MKPRSVNTLAAMSGNTKFGTGSGFDASAAITSGTRDESVTRILLPPGTVFRDPTILGLPESEHMSGRARPSRGA